jgi:hypothetical protein
MAIWVRDPHAGGAPISDALKRETSRRLMAYAQKRYASKDARLDIRFRGSFCYVDARIEPAGKGRKSGRGSRATEDQGAGAPGDEEARSQAPEVEGGIARRVQVPCPCSASPRSEERYAPTNDRGIVGSMLDYRKMFALLVELDDGLGIADIRGINAQLCDTPMSLLGMESAVSVVRTMVGQALPKIH